MEWTDENAADVSSDRLGADQAFLRLSSTAGGNLFLYELSDDCHRCVFAKWRTIRPAAQRLYELVKFSTEHPSVYRVYDRDQGDWLPQNATDQVLTEIRRPSVGAFGVYGMSCADEGCEWSELRAPLDESLAILYFILIIAILAVLIRGADLLWKRRQRIRTALNANSLATSASTANLESSSASNTISSSPNASATATSATATVAVEGLPTVAAKRIRLRSLDTFRGLAIVLMIFVNSGGGHYWWMEHATWNGLHVADVVFPCFLWIMGVCIPMSVQSQLARRTAKSRMILDVCTRSVKLFLLGLFLNSAHGPLMAELRIMGVLQRFGVAYFVVATLHILLHRPAQQEQVQTGAGWSTLRRAMYDVELLWSQWLVMLSLVAVYLGVVLAMPVPNCPSGYLGPGGRHDWAAHRDCTGGASGYIDRLLLTDPHLYQWGTARSTYGTSERLDPEGLFGCLLTIVHAFLGLQCGSTLQVHTAPAARLRRWLLWAVGCAVLGAGLAGFSVDDGPIPMNKNLWSLSFVLVTAGLAYAVLAGCYALADVQRWWSGAPFRWAGMNAIVMYCGHELLHSILPFRWRIGPMNTHLVLLVQNGWNAGLWMVVAWCMYRRKWFVTV